MYGFNFTGPITASVGQTLTGLQIANGCYALSSNSITLSSDGFEGGTVSTENGETEVYTCPNDGVSDIIRFDSAGVTDYASYTYVVTDENNIILALPGSDFADFDGAGAGICRVWGLAYTGSITANVGDDAAAVVLADGCFDLSS